MLLRLFMQRESCHDHAGPFFVANRDLVELLAFAEQQECQAIPEVIPAESTIVARRPSEISEESPIGGDFFYLIPGDFAVVEAFYQEMEFEPGRSKLLARTSPVIELCPCFAGTKPLEGRIYFAQESSDPRYTTTLQLFEHLQEWIAANWTNTTTGSFYLGRDTARLCHSGAVDVSYGGKPLQPSE